MKYIQALVTKVLGEPAVTLGIVVAAINTATDQTWKGYAVAIAIALLRQLVSPVYEYGTEPRGEV